MLILGFFYPSPLFLALIIFVTSSADKVENVSLICKTSSTFGNILAFEAYDFLMLKGLEAFLSIQLTLLSEGEIAKDNSITDSD